MTTFVLKRQNDSVQVLSEGETVTLDDGTKIPYENLSTYTPQILASFGLYAFDDPISPAGQYLVSVSYVATPEGVDQIPVFDDLPPGPIVNLANIAAAGTYKASLRQQARRYEKIGNATKAIHLYLKASGVQL